MNSRATETQVAFESILIARRKRHRFAQHMRDLWVLLEQGYPPPCVAECEEQIASPTDMLIIQTIKTGDVLSGFEMVKYDTFLGGGKRLKAHLLSMVRAYE